jgi:hypothetical protein
MFKPIAKCKIGWGQIKCYQYKKGRQQGRKKIGKKMKI